MFYAVGLETGRVYAVGKYKSNIFRILQADYPTCKDELKGAAIIPVLPETIIIKKG